jgi:hypothetical protein
MRTDLTSTSALAPGYATLTITRGGAMEGNCDVGRVSMASIPIKTMISDITIANTGLFMNILNIFFLLCFGFLHYSVGNFN